jgi:multidrug efflux pump subunit AcrA (membrane-fusion protein)
MTKYLLLLLPLLGLANQITVEHAQMRPLGKIIQTNAEITQLSDQKQEIVSRLSGHVEAYFVKAGEKVKSGDKVVLIESIKLSKMSATYIALLQQVKAAKEQLSTTRKLYKKRLTSKNDLSNSIIALEEIRSKQNALASQLESLGITPSKLTKATDQFILYAHADGVVGRILVPLHSNVDAKTSLMTLVSQSGYYAIAYLGVDDAMKVSAQTKGWLSVAKKQYPCHFVQLLPHIDKETQRAKVLFQIEKSPENLLLGAYTQIEISLAPYRNVMMVKKSALTLFQGEWVVFVEEHHDEERHDEERHDEEGHDEHEELPYTPKVVKIIAYTGDYVAVEGINADEEYVSEGVYFVKSMMLKSSLGEHGH